MLHLFSLVAFCFLSILFQFHLHFASHISMIFLLEAFCPTQDLLSWLYHIMIGCQCKDWSLHLHWWYLLPWLILRSSMLCHKRQVILLSTWILQLFSFSLNSRLLHMNCCFYQIKRLYALLDYCHLVYYWTRSGSQKGPMK